MPRPQTAAIQAALAKFNRANEAYLAQEELWLEEWDRKATPFDSVSWYCSPEQRKARAKALAPVLKAREQYLLACAVARINPPKWAQKEPS